MGCDQSKTRKQPTPQPNNKSTNTTTTSQSHQPSSDAASPPRINVPPPEAASGSNASLPITTSAKRMSIGAMPKSPRPLNVADVEIIERPVDMTEPITPMTIRQSIDPLYRLENQNVLGTGGFSSVVPAVQLSSGRRMAVKIIHKSILTSAKKKAVVAHEREILRRTRHPNIVHLYEVVETPTVVYFVMDLMKTDLYEYARKCISISERDVAVIMRSIFRAVAYLHDNHIVHRDIKLENILINSVEDVKLADFGLAKFIVPQGGNTVSCTPCGTSDYMAPEIIASLIAQGPMPMVTTSETVKFIDVWACGIMLYCLLCGRPPYIGEVDSVSDCKRFLHKMDRGVMFPDKYWKNISEGAKDLVMKLLSREAGERITARQALQHPFLSKADSGSPDCLMTPMVLQSLTKVDVQKHIDAMHAANIEDHNDHDVDGEDEGPHHTQNMKIVPAASAPKAPVVMKSNLLERRKELAANKKIEEDAEKNVHQN